MNTYSKTESIVDQYRGRLKHPLIDVLPRIPKDFKAMAAELEYLPTPPNEEVRQMAPDERFRLASMLRSIHVASRRDVELAYIVDQLIRVGLEARPLVASHYSTSKSRLSEFVKAVNSKTPAKIQTPSASLVARSGDGKSRTCDQALRRYPQVIHHDTRSNPLLPPKQVVTLNLECPSDRTVPSLVMEFINKLEQAIQEKIPERFRQGNRSQLISNMGQLCETYWLGLIVIDECQHALKQNHQPETLLMNFLVEMNNKLKIPILFVGTPLSLKLIGGQLRQARRMLGVEWSGFSEVDPEWIKFIEKIWPYQFTKYFTQLDDALRSSIFDYSHGIPAFAITLYENAQRYAIGAASDEIITPAHFGAVYDDLFKAVKPMIEALKSKDPVRISQFEDLSHTEETQEWFDALSKLRRDLQIKAVKRVSSAHKRAVKQMVKSAQADAAAFTHSAAPNVLNESTIKCLIAAHQLGVDPAEIIKAVTT
jgi:hypothetical protein